MAQSQHVVGSQVDFCDFQDSQNYKTEARYQKIKQRQEQMRDFVCIYL